MAVMVAKAAAAFREAAVVGFRDYKRQLDDESKRQLLAASYKFGFRQTMDTARYLEKEPDHNKRTEITEERVYPLGPVLIKPSHVL